MSDTKIVVPEGMLKAAMDATGQTVKGCPWQEISEVAVKAALLWLSENPIAPTDQQVESLYDSMIPLRFERMEVVPYTVVEWQRRMFLAPEPEVPEEIKDLLWTVPTPDCGIYLVAKHNADVIESFRRSQKAGPK